MTAHDLNSSAMKALSSSTTIEKVNHEQLETKTQIPMEPTSTPWSRWYENRSPSNEKQLSQIAEEARSQWRTTLSKLNLNAKELEDQESIQSPKGFLVYVQGLESKQQDKRETRTRDQVLKNLTSFESFTKAYSPVVDVVKGADPFGAAGVVWGLCSVAVTIIANKQLTDKTIHEVSLPYNGLHWLRSADLGATPQSIETLVSSLPMLDGYGELYPTDRMMILIAELYAQVMTFLPKAFIYYRHSGWKGSFERLMSSASDDDFSKTLIQIERTSQAITKESTIGMSSEIRTTRLEVQESRLEVQETRLEVQETRKKQDELSDSLEETSLKVRDLEIAECHKALSHTKKYLVHMDYDLNKIWTTASSQICRGLQQTTTQSHACRKSMDGPPIVDWLSSGSGATGKLKNILWIHSSNPRDLGISHIALETVSRLRNSSDEGPQGSSISGAVPIVLHSMHQTELPYLACTDTKRTTITLLKEAIYQLLVRQSSPVPKHKILESLAGSAPGTAKTSLELLGSLMSDLLDEFPSNVFEARHPGTTLPGSTHHPKNLTQPIFWIIDRIDECAFSHSQGGSKLYDFAKLLEKLVGGPKSRLRVLITSLYPPQRCDSKWADSTEIDEDGLKSWAECEYGKR